MRDTSKDIFVRFKHDLKLNAITHFQIQNEAMLLALNGQTLLHIRLQNFKQRNLKIQIDINDRIAHLHLDYNGIHGFVSTVAGENLYVNMRNGNLKPLRRIKGQVISAIGWNCEFSKDTETGFILLGTTNGNIYETNLTSTGTMNYLKQLSANLSEKELSISGLHLRQLADSEADYLSLICMPNRIYCLIGTANLQAASQQPVQQVVGTVWSSVMVEPSQEAVLQALFNFKGGKKPQYLAMCPDKENEHPPSGLAVFPIFSDDEIQPFRFAWLAADGLAVGKIDTNKMATMKRDSADGRELLNVEINIKHNRSEGRLDYPLDICLTEFHLILLYTGRLAAISLFDRTLAFEDFYTGVSKVVGMARDASSQLLWVFAEPTIFKYQPNEESRNIWRIFMEQGEFGKAKKIANQLADKRPFQMIIKKEAEKFIGEKNFVAAAESLAQSDEPFEKLVLLMLKDGPGSRNGLKRFLELKLNQIHSNKERVNRDMLVLWLLEIQLAELAELRKNISANEVVESSSTRQNEAMDQQKEAEIRRLKDQLYCFINRQIVFEAITDNQAAVYRMVSTHVDFDVQLYLAQRLRDTQTVIKILLMQRGYKEILDILAKEARPELFYEYAEELMREIPGEIVALMLRQEKALNAQKLLPAFCKCFDPELRNRAKIVESTFLFAERISPATTPKAMLDFMINLFATFRPQELLAFLHKCAPSKFGQSPPFDVGKAIQICGEHGLIECRVYLLCVEGLFEDAIKLALTISVDLAKRCARELDEAIEQKNNESLADYEMGEKGIDLGGGHSSGTLQEMRKRVWLEIAKNMIQNGVPIAQCLAILAESQGAIRIQDVLGYFPEFTKIEHFKEPLLDCIKEYSIDIKNLQREIRDATEMAEELREEIDKSKSGFMVVRAGGQCALCNELLLQRPFVAFICRHFYHRDCLEAKTRGNSVEYANLEAEERLLRKELQLAALGKKKTAAGGGKQRVERRGGKEEEMATQRRLDEIRHRMRELLCGDCPLCGLQVIEEIDKPFFESPEEYFEQLKKWMPSLT